MTEATKPEKKEEEKEKAKRRWIQMGVELEGGWYSSIRDVIATVKGARQTEEVSVKVGYKDGEIITRPHATLDALCSDVSKLYPDHVNDTCGLHIHVSFTPMDASILASRDFYAYYKSAWMDWGKRMGMPRAHQFWERLAGTNRFALDEFYPEEQLSLSHSGADIRERSVKGHRYTMLSFTPWAKYKTIESRHLPMFSDKTLAILAIRELADIYDRYLNSHDFPAVEIKSGISVTPNEVVETYESITPSLVPFSRQEESSFEGVVTGPGVFYSIPGAQMMPFVDDLGPSEP